MVQATNVANVEDARAILESETKTPGTWDYVDGVKTA